MNDTGRWLSHFFQLLWIIGWLLVLDYQVKDALKPKEETKLVRLESQSINECFLDMDEYSIWLRENKLPRRCEKE